MKHTYYLKFTVPTDGATPPTMGAIFRMAWIAAWNARERQAGSLILKGEEVEHHPYPEDPQVCEQCGSEDVTFSDWMHANTRQSRRLESPPVDREYCEDCEKTLGTDGETRLIFRSEYRERIDLR